MTATIVTSRYTLLTGDSRAEMALLPAEKARMGVMSPPYYGLRWYGDITTRAYWGGSLECEHSWEEVFGPNMTGGTGDKSSKQVTNRGSQFGNEKEEPPSLLCQLCGRWWGELGREPTPQLYVEHLLDVFDSFHRVLADDGTLWLNIGDSYAGSGKGPTGHNGIGNAEKRQGFRSKGVNKLPPGYKHKDLLGIPFLVFMGLQSRGWYFRQVIIWDKDNPFPESVKDRCSNSHEYIGLFSKSRRYYYDSEAIAEPIKPFIDKNGVLRTHKNRRSVWHFPTQHVKGHSAVFPERLPELCIKAGSEANDIIVDLFSGSATTGVAALKLGRRYLGIDIVPEYTALGCARMQDVHTSLGIS